MFRFILAAVVVLNVAACATTAVPRGESVAVPGDRLYALQAKASSEAGTLVVTRDSGFLGAGCFIGFYVDGTLAAKFEPGESATFTVSAGEHVIGVGNPGAGLCSFGGMDRKEITTVARPGEAKYFRLAIRPGEGPTVEPTTLR